MPKRRQKNDSNETGSGGGRRGFLNGSPRGFSPRGNGRGTGPSRGRGGRGFGGTGGYIPSTETDFILQVWPQNSSGSEHNWPRGRGGGGGRGRGRGNYASPIYTSNGANSGSGYNSPNGRGRGRGRGRGEVDNRGRGRDRAVQTSGWKGKDRGIDGPLSRLLIEDRPLLKVINFVPGVHQPYLFMEQEELLKPVREDIGDEEERHVPTADRVAQVFGIASDSNRGIESSAEENVNEEGLDEIDFTDLASFQAAIETSASTATRADKMDVEETFTGIYTKSKSQQGVSREEEFTEDHVAMELPAAASQIVSETAATINIGQSLSGKNSQTSLFDERSTSVVDKDGVVLVQADVLSVTQDTECFSTTTPHRKTDFGISEPGPSGTGNDSGRQPISTSEEISQVSSTIATMDLDDSKPTAESPSFFIDTAPAIPRSHTTITSGEALGLPEEDIIVYVAPYPRSGRVTPAPSHAQNYLTPTPMVPVTSVLTGIPIGESPKSVPAIPQPPTIDSVSFSFDSSVAASSSANLNTPQPNRTAKPPLFTFMQTKATPARMKMLQRNAWLKNKRRKSSSFALRGVEVSEARLWGGQDDSDVDWGDDSEDGEEEEEEVQEVRAEKDGTLRVVSVSKSQKGKGAEGMEVDPELNVDTATLNAFVEGMSRGFVTMDDLDDERRMREEDHAGLGGGVGSSAESEDDTDDEDAVVELEEGIMIGEDGEEEGFEWDDDEDEDFSPKSSFQARLDKLRKQAQESSSNSKGKAKATDQDFYEDLEGSEDENYENRRRCRTWAQDDNDYIAGIEDMLAENQEILMGRDRKAALFRAVRDGNFDLDEDFTPQARKRKDKNKDLPPELADLWARDREKKAERRRERDLAKLLQIADPLAAKKGGKKGRKVTARLANMNPTITTIPNRVIDTTTLVQQIRRFLENIGGPQQMALPPTNKETRKMVHELAQAFNLKSESKGKANNRYTTLIKTTKSVHGVVNEQRIGKIVRWARARGVEFASKEEWAYDGNKGGRMPKHKEGDEVGKAAPKLNDSNVGFRLLAAMGWEEGDRIGLSGGLKDPLTAVIKHSKLGLGASR